MTSFLEPRTGQAQRCSCSQFAQLCIATCQWLQKHFSLQKTGQILKCMTGGQQTVMCCNATQNWNTTRYLRGDDGRSSLLALRTLHCHKFGEHTTCYNSLRNLCWVLHLPSQQYQLCVPVQKKEQEWAVHHQICGCSFQPLGNYKQNIKSQCDSQVHTANNWAVRFFWRREQSSQ